MNVLAHQMRNLDGFDPSAYLLEQIEGPRMFTYYYPLKDHTAGEGLRMVRAIDARIEADTHSSQIIVMNLYRQRSGFAPQYFVLGHQTASSRVYTRVKRLGEPQTFSEAVYR